MVDPQRDLGGADPYSLLGVDRDADDATIISAHRRLIRQVHPDLTDGDAERTKLLNLARTVLLDPDLRADYDAGPPAATASPPTQSAWNEADVMRGPGSSPITDPPSAPPIIDDVVDAWPQPAAPPNWDAVPTYKTYQYPSYVYPASAYGYPPLQYRYVEPASNVLGILSLVMAACLCGPVGAVLGIVALALGRRTGFAGRVCAWIAIGLAVMEFIAFIVFYAILLIGPNAAQS
jgi:hypothetical protein